MAALLSQAFSRYVANKADNEPVLITPESSKLLRGLLRLTLQAAADGSSVKKNQLDRFEREGHSLSPRDGRWLQSMFEAAGAEFSMGQGSLQVTLKGEPVIIQGELAARLQNLPTGTQSTYARHVRKGIEKPDAGPRWSIKEHLSQKDVARLAGISPGKVSAIENNRHSKYHLADVLDLKKAYARIPEDEALRAGIKSGMREGGRFIGGWFDDGYGW